MAPPRAPYTPRAPGPGLAELSKPCGRPGCGHPNGVHTGGTKAFGWAIYDKVWANASGTCNAPDCECRARLASVNQTI